MTRYQSAKELAIDLERIREGKEVHAYAKGFAQRGALVKEKEEETAQRNFYTRQLFLGGLGGSNPNYLKLGLLLLVKSYKNTFQNHGQKQLLTLILTETVFCLSQNSPI
jgi:hypothetical protein